MVSHQLCQCHSVLKACLQMHPSAWRSIGLEVEVTAATRPARTSAERTLLCVSKQREKECEVQRRLCTPLRRLKPPKRITAASARLHHPGG